MNYVSIMIGREIQTETYVIIAFNNILYQNIHFPKLRIYLTKFDEKIKILEFTWEELEKFSSSNRMLK